VTLPILPPGTQARPRKSVIRLPNNWEPRLYQRPAWNYLWNGGKRAICIWHRRAGKDDICLHWAAVSMVRRPATYWHMLPEYAQGRRAIWTAINPHSGIRRIDEAFPKELRATTNEQEMFIRFKNGSTWQIVGSDNFNSVVGSPPAGVVFSEWALSNPSAWAYIAPILSENGGWAAFITTPRGRNHAHSMFQMAQERPDDWFTEILTVEDTKAISMEVVEAQRQEYHGIYGAEAGDALIEQEYFSSFSAAVLGAYWGKEMDQAEQEGRLDADLEAVENLPVHTAWDLGMDDSMAIWMFQIVPPTENSGVTIRVLDYYENSGHGMRHYVEAVEAMRLNLGAEKGFDYVPHDAKVRMLDEEGRTRVQVLQALGRKPRLVLPHKVIDGINAVRVTLPRVYFHRKRCAKGIEALRQYRADFDEKGRTFRQAPKHDWTSHGSDAFRYLCMAWKNIALDEPDLVEHAATMAKRGSLGSMTVDEYLKRLSSNSKKGRERV
jgi:phage terminase large subunit